MRNDHVTFLRDTIHTVCTYLDAVQTVQYRLYVCTISMHVRTYVHVCVLDTVYWVYLSTVYSIRYLRGTEERGLILGSVDEITQSLEDNAMNLQSMAASRFVQPFFDRVQKWEKSLSHISEVVDVRESVFVHTHVQYVCM